MRKAVPVTKRQVKALNKSLPQWQLQKKDTILKRVIPLTSYIDGLTLIARIAIHAQVRDHHPEIHYTYDTVTILLTTHDCGQLTKADVELAQLIDRIII